MASYTTSQAGNWSAQATWGGSGPPGNGDTATVNHNVTVDVNTTVGTSPASSGTTALTINPGLDTQDMITSSGIKNNYGWNLQTGFAGKGFNTNQASNPGSSNTLVSGGTGPNFVDNTRNLQNWAVHRGSTSNTQAGKIADGLSYLAADPTLIYNNSDSLWKWVQAGFAPQNQALKGAASDGGDIGAVAVVAPPPPATGGSGGQSQSSRQMQQQMMWLRARQLGMLK